MKSPKRSGTGLAVIIALVLATPGRVEAQVAFFSAIGYSAIGVGLGLGVGSKFGTECEGELCVAPGPAFGVLLGGVGGLLFGAELGLRASRRVAAGESVSEVHRRGLALGTVLGGAIVGAGLGGMSGNEAGVGLGALGGVGLAFALLGSRWDSFVGKTVQVRPAAVGGQAGVIALIWF